MNNALCIMKCFVDYVHLLDVRTNKHRPGINTQGPISLSTRICLESRAVVIVLTLVAAGRGENHRFIAEVKSLAGTTFLKIANRTKKCLVPRGLQHGPCRRPSNNNPAKAHDQRVQFEVNAVLNINKLHFLL